MRKYQPHLIYGALSLAIMLPLLKPGFVLTLDMVFTPHIRMPGDVMSSYLFYVLLHWLNAIVPSDVLQKIILLAIPYLSGWGMYRLLQHAHEDRLGGSSVNWGAYVGGFLYAVNPFVYSRFMAGQFAVLLGYSLLPFAVRSLLILVRKPSLRGSVALGIWLTVIGVVSIHTLGSIAILCITALLLVGWRYRHQRGRLVRVLKSLGLSLGLMAVLSSYWLVPLALGHGATAQAVNGFTAGDQRAFETLGGGLVGRLANVLRLQGFWAEGHNLFRLPQAHMLGWGIIVLLLWSLVVIGIRSSWRRHERFIVVLLAASAGVGVLLAIDVANTILGRILPFFSGFREPQKFVVLVALAYAFFAGQGVNALFGRYGHSEQWARQSAVLIVALLLPALLTPTMFWGFGGQLRARQYPPAWTAMNNRLDQDNSSYNVLFLPWHLYMYYDFVGRIIASPSTSYFDKPMIASNQMELKGASPTSTDARKTLLSNVLLPQASKGTRLGTQLAPLHIKYILLDKDDDYRKYAYLDGQTDLHLLVNNTHFLLYQNMAYRSTP